MKEIIDYKNQGFSDEETLKQLKVLEKVMSTTKKQKIGRGKTATEIDVYGVDMRHETEYATQRPCMEYWVGYARGKGIEVNIYGPTAICKYDKIYR